MIIESAVKPHQIPANDFDLISESNKTNTECQFNGFNVKSHYAEYNKIPTLANQKNINESAVTFIRFLEQCDNGDFLLQQAKNNGFGLLLTHRHHTLKPCEFILEKQGEYPKENAEKALISQPVNLNDIPNDTKFAPSSWYVSADSENYPFEFSTDRSVISSAQSSEKMKIKDMLCKHISDSGLQKQLGITLLNRDYLTLPSKDDHIFHEITIVDDDDIIKSIVTVKPKALTQEESVYTTSVTFDMDDKSHCFSYTVCSDYSDSDSGKQAAHIGEEKHMS